MIRLNCFRNFDTFFSFKNASLRILTTSTSAQDYLNLILSFLNSGYNVWSEIKCICFRHATPFEPPHVKTNKMICAPSEDWSAWASAESYQSLRSTPDGLMWSQCFSMRTAKTDQTGRMPRLIRGFAGRKDHFVGFVMRRLICAAPKGETLQEKKKQIALTPPYNVVHPLW